MAIEPTAYPAPAKLNLFLHVTGRRPDGYHELQTVFRFIDYGDTLSFRLRDDGRIQRVSELPGVPPEQDLVVRAARLLAERCGKATPGVDIHVVKRLPMGGGLGGGSSDAATTLLVLNQLWGCGLDRARLQQLGLSLGADVPVFLFGHNAFAEGVGEKLEAITLPPAWYLVLIPPVEIPTAKIFGHPALTRDTKAMKMADFFRGYPGQVGHNDLQAVACMLYPEVAERIEWLSRFGYGKMTGSGACVFAEFANQASAQAAFAELPTGWQGFLAVGLDRHPLAHL